MSVVADASQVLQRIDYFKHPETTESEINEYWNK